MTGQLSKLPRHLLNDHVDEMKLEDTKIKFVLNNH